MKRLINITKAKTKWAKEMLKEYGPIVQVADDITEEKIAEKSDAVPCFRLVSVIEDDTWDFKNWSYWVNKDEIEFVEVKL